MNPIPVYLLTGYLGAGKTTVLNNWLGCPEVNSQKTVVLMNEFGDLAVDGSLVSTQDCDILELNQGSLFCVCVKTNLLKILSKIADELQPELLLIEATGVADVFDIQQIFDLPKIEGKFKIEANVCVVDAVNFTKVVSYLRAVGTQVRWADGLLLTKSDLLDPEAERRMLDLMFDLNPRAPQEAITKGDIAWSFIEELEHRIPPKGESLEPPTDISAWSCRPKKVDLDAFRDAVDSLGENVLRMKGYLDAGDGPVFVESVCGEWQTPIPWTPDEDDESPEPPKIGAAFVLWRVDQEKVERILKPTWTKKK
jgi:G3E family GTPase